MVVVVNADELSEAQVAGHRRSFVAYTFHQITIAYERKGEVIAEVASKPGAKVGLSDGHSNGVRDALPEWPSRDFNAGSVPSFWVAGSF